MTTAGISNWKVWLASSGSAYGAPITLALLVFFNAVFTPHFATVSNLWNVLLQVSATLLVAIGMALVIATGGIDLSVGSLMAVASAIAVLLLGRGAGVALLGGLAAASCLGLVNGLLITRFAVQPFITTIAVMISGRGLAQILCNEGELIPFTNARFEYLGRGYLGRVPMPALIAAAVLLLTWFVLRVTIFGRYLVAVGGNEAAARLAGVPVQRVRLVVYALSGLLAGLAGLMETARLGITDPSNIGVGMEFAAIAAVVIGGTPLSGGKISVAGTITGSLIMAVLANSLNMLLVPFAWTLLLQAAIILAAVYVQRTRIL